MFRNSEVRGCALASMAFLAVWSAFCMWAAGMWAGILAAAGGLCITSLWLWLTGRRYQRLEQLSADLDRLLHGSREMNLEQYREGELSILINQVQKLLLRLTEQSEVLKKEKVYLSDSLADISHQLRTPLTSLHLILSRLQKETEGTERRRLSYEGIQLLERLDWLVNALLKISRIDAGTAVFSRDWVSAQELAGKALSPLSIPMELREQQVICDIQKDAGFTGDFAWSAEALGNILKNCMEHTGPGGTIRLKAEENRLYTEFVVEDNGTGIDPEDLRSS